MTHHPSAASLRLHGARLLFPPVATLLFLLLTEYIARGTLSGDTFVQYIFPHPEAYLLAWGLLFLVWMAVDWLTRFAPLATLLSALLGCLPATVDFYILQLRGEPLPPVGPDAGVRGGRRGLRGGHPRPEEHGRLRRRGAGSDRRLLLPLPGPSEAALGAASGGLRGQHGGHLRPHLRGVFAACRHPVAGHPARRMDAGPLLPLLRRHHQLPHQPDESGDRQARGLLRGGHQRHPRQRGGRGEVHHQPGLARAPTPPRPRQTNR